jgi:Glycosyl transferase family 2
MTPLAWFCFFLAVLPSALMVWNLSLYRIPPMTSGARISILIPVRDEEANVAAAVSHALAQRDVDVDLIVLDDGSTDGTSAILATFTDPRLRILRGGLLPAGWSGKQYACWTLAAEARHDLLVFVDADVRLAADACSRVAGFMLARPDIGLASGFPRQITVSWLEQLLLPLIHFLLLSYLPIAAMKRSSSVGLGAGCGQLMVARRAAYDAVGGHAAICRSLHDGIKLPRAFRAAGFETGLFDAAPFAACRMYRSAAEVWSGLMKNATEGMATCRGLPLWTVLLGCGQVLPVVLVLTGGGLPADLALATGIGSRLVLAARFRQPLVTALLHPLGVATILVVQWTALVRAGKGLKNTWRGRSYPAA